VHKTSTSIACWPDQKYRSEWFLEKGGNSFCWGGRKLDEIVKLDLLMGKGQNEVELIWKEYHKGLTNTVGSVLSGEDGMKVLSRAQEC